MSAAVSANKSYFNNFPTALLSQVSTFLCLADLFKLAYSCKAGHEAVNSPLTWKGRVERAIVNQKNKAGERQHLAIVRDTSPGTSEKEIFRRGLLAIRAEEVYKTIPRRLIDALGGFEAYQVLPVLDLQGRKDRLCEPLSVRNLSQSDLVNERGIFCPIMRGWFQEKVDVARLSDYNWQYDNYTSSNEQRIETRRFIAIAVNTKDIPCDEFLLSFFERQEIARDRLGKKVTPPLLSNYGLSSPNTVSEEDFATVRSILAGTHPLFTLAKKK